MYFLDSDVCIELMRGRLPITYGLMRQSPPELFGVPAIVEAELRLGAAKSNDPEGGTLLLERFLKPFKSIVFDGDCAVAYGVIRADLEQRGCRIGPNDLLVAATASAHNAVLITGNVREFIRVRGLQVQRWDEVSLV